MPAMIVKILNTVQKGIYVETSIVLCTAIPVIKTVTSIVRITLLQNA